MKSRQSYTLTIESCLAQQCSPVHKGNLSRSRNASVTVAVSEIWSANWELGVARN